MRIVQTNNSIDAGAATSRPKVEKLHPVLSKNPNGTLGVRAHIDMLNEAQDRFKSNEDSEQSKFRNQFKTAANKKSRQA